MRVQEAERRLLALELFGMRFGLDRMRRLMTAMSHPQRAFDSIHVVGTNGKSSTTRMIAAILASHGLRTGSYLSPHLVSFCERIRIDDADLEPAAFAAAVARALRAAEMVDRSAVADDRVTQFEVLTAAAFSELARRGVEVAVIEAGLGGRFDATNVIPSKVQVLTSAGLEHTRWLGPTVEAIAREKLDVVQPGATLVLGSGLPADAVAVAEVIAAQRAATIVNASADPGISVGALGAFQRRNFAAAQAAAQAYLGRLDSGAVAAAAADVRIPGRLQVFGSEPLTLLDGAHNPEGIAALVESLPELRSGRGDLVAVVSILDDKDAPAMLAQLVPACAALVLTSSQSPRTLPPPTLQSLVGQLGAPYAEAVRDPRAALQRARELAGVQGVVLATGSIYLVADLVSDARALSGRRASML
ncbi:MAG: bifunctional folylpolyglutamate synthase/dihydrofolate synthase [Solirubrobacteraceae bacterium]